MRRLFDFLRPVWRRLPLSVWQRKRIQATFFRSLPFIFHQHPAFPARSLPSHEREDHSADPLIAQDAHSDTSVYVPLLDAAPLKEKPARLIAFYLPQFHPIPENDEWWGRGFTEWTNVVRGRPQFHGHYQPHLPGELGFYDLRVPEVQVRQVELAQLYGLSGFAFYFYWFGGRRLLERPLKSFAASPALDFPFCICWANESWSRNWDGRERDILVAQHHCADDDLAFIEYIACYLQNPRYLRIGKRPLLIVYRPDLMPDAGATVERWRQWCRNKKEIGEIFVAYVQSFETTDPKKYAMDGAIEFPPNNMAPRDITQKVGELDDGFSGVVYDWRELALRGRNYQCVNYPLFRGVNPGWDNTARRSKSGAILYGSSPHVYRDWLENAILDTTKRFPDRSSRLVFINAWNEWAEGAHLEPDQRYGYAYLQATRDALRSTRVETPRSILVVSHDAHQHGAQLLALSIARELREELGYRVLILVLGEGPLLPKYNQIAETICLHGQALDGAIGTRVADILRGNNIRNAIVNTVAAGGCAAFLARLGIEIVSLIHELPGLIRSHGLQEFAEDIVQHARRIVFPARFVANEFGHRLSLAPGQEVIRPQGIYKRNQYAPCRIGDARRELRSRLHLADEAKIVLAVGYADQRKGFDLFLEIGLLLCRAVPSVHLIWVGKIEQSVEEETREWLVENELIDRISLVGFIENTDFFYAGSDLYALTSREDPFPSVALEALEVGVPVIAFQDTGGIQSIGPQGGVMLAPAFDVQSFSSIARSLLENPEQRAKTGISGAQLIERDFSFRRYVMDLLGETTEPLKKVSVIIPNFNYCRYLNERIESIFNQTAPVYEVILLDDASTDGSPEWISCELKRRYPQIRAVLNRTNSGSPFRQWHKGIAMAQGEYIWIAEADDLAKPEFLREALAGVETPEVVMSFTQSQQIDSDANLLARDYLDYVGDISPERWRHNYVADGVDEIRAALSVKNTIPNVSAVIFRRDCLQDVLEKNIDRICSYKFAGDWVTYIEILKMGKIAYSPRALNQHRRHDNGVTISGFGVDQLREIISVQNSVAASFDLEAEAKKRAERYAKALSEQFGLNSPEFLGATGNP